MIAVVLLNDDSLYIYEAIALQKGEGFTSIDLIKHIHPVERRDRWTYHKEKISANKVKCNSAKKTLIEVSKVSYIWKIVFEIVKQKVHK